VVGKWWLAPGGWFSIFLYSRWLVVGFRNPRIFNQPPTTTYQSPLTNHQPPTTKMINTLVLDRTTKSFTHISDPDLISDHCARASGILWVDVADPTSSDFDDLAREFGFHPLSIEDCRHQHQRPKVEEYPGYYFIVLYEAEMQDGCQLELRELGVFLGVNYLVTVHSQPIRNIEKARRLWRQWTDLAERERKKKK
jgi:Mg2+ and Co2+ transporter CorA